MKVKRIFKNKLVASGSWYTITNLFISGLGFITIPIFTRLLSPEDYGLMALYGVWVSLFSVFMSLDLAWSVERGKFDFEDTYDKYISSVLSLSIILFLISLTIVTLFRSFFLELTSLSTSMLYIMMVQAFFVFVQTFSLAKFRVEYKYKMVSIINILVAVLGIILAVAFVLKIFPNDRYLGVILGRGFLVIVVGFIYLVYFLVKGKEFVNFKYWKYALMISVPFLLHNVAGIVNAQFDRIVINKYIGITETGLYSFAYNVGMIMSVVQTSFIQAFGPFFFENMKTGDKSKILKVGHYYRSIFCVIYGSVLMISPEAVKILANKNYWEGIKIMPYVFMSVFFTFMMGFEVYTQYWHKEMKFRGIGTLIGTFINVSLNLLLVPQFGYVMAAITTAASQLAIFIFHFMANKHILKDSFYGFKFHLKSLLFLVVVTVSFIIGTDYIVFRLLFVAILLITFYFKCLKHMLREVKF